MTDKELVERYRMALEAILATITAYTGTHAQQAYRIATKALEVK